MTRNDDHDLPTLTVSDDDAVVGMLRLLQRMVLEHPDAARSMFRALVREGRAFAQTRDGARWKQRVERSELVSRALLVLQTTTFWMLEDDNPGAMPSALVEAVASAASSPGRDAMIENLLRELDGELPP